LAFASRREKAWRLIPLPIAAGLVFQLGWGFLVDAFSKALRQRDWLNLALALVIAVACVRFGYVVGVIGGVICACLMFAAGYARVGVVRQHLSRAQFAGNVNRSTEASHYLSEAGEASRSIGCRATSSSAPRRVSSSAHARMSVRCLQAGSAT